MDHEPCKSRGNCYHVRAARIGARKTNATWGKTPEAREARARGGRIGGCNGSREGKARGGRNGARNQPREAKARGGRIGGPIGGPIGGRKTQETWGKTPEAHEAKVRGGIRGGQRTAELLRLKPNIGEATVAALLVQFYPDVWADLIWQRGSSKFRGVPDIRHPTRVIGEYDGGGHNAFGDRTEADKTRDAERREVGYIVIRDTNPYVLARKFAYAVRLAGRSHQ